MMNALICMAMFVGGWCSPTSAVDLSSFLASLWDAPQCEEFMSDAAWVVVEDKIECGNANCNLPREICMESAEMAFTDGNRQIQCRTLPNECFDAVSSGHIEAGKEDGSESSPETTTQPLSSVSTEITPSTTTLQQVKIIVATDTPSTFGSTAPVVERTTTSPEEFTTRIDSTATFIIPSSTTEIGTTEEESTPTTPIAPTSQEDICTMGRNMGRPGEGCHRTYNFFFDNKRKICTRMLYWGCGGNANRFPTMLECESASAHCDSSLIASQPSTERPNSGPAGDVCHQPKPVGRFCGYKQMFYYNTAQKTCQQFWFPGCLNEQTNDNIFESAEECNVVTSGCNSGENSKGNGDVDSPVDQIEKGIRGSECQLSRNIGYQNCPTGGWTRKFFFDIDESVCKSFWYLGCGGNSNRFDSITECRKQCLSN